MSNFPYIFEAFNPNLIKFEFNGRDLSPSKFKIGNQQFEIITQDRRDLITGRRSNGYFYWTWWDEEVNVKSKEVEKDKYNEDNGY